MTETQGKRRKQLLDNLKETRRYRKLKKEALDRNVWRTDFGKVDGPVLRQTAGCTTMFKPFEQDFPPKLYVQSSFLSCVPY